MFSLIITIISIALVAALAIATIYYGGSVFSGGKSKAEAAKTMNEISQITGALKMYQVDHAGSMPTTMDDLVTQKYLASLPQADWSVSNGVLQSTTTSDDACTEFNKSLGITGIPTCTNPAYLDVKVCCSN